MSKPIKKTQKKGLKLGLVDLISTGSVTGIPWYWSYSDIVAQKSDPDYSPYSYVEDWDEPVFFDEQTLEEWDWE